MEHPIEDVGRAVRAKWQKSLKGLKAKLERYADQIFRERQLLLRTDGRVHYLFLTVKLQKIFASVLAVMALVALITGARLAYQSYQVHRGEQQIAELQAENVEMATALASAAALRKTEERVAASVRQLGDTLFEDVDRVASGLERAGIRASDLLPRELTNLAAPTISPAARRSDYAAYARDLERLEGTLEAWATFRTAVQSIPLARPVDDGRLTSAYGFRKHPVTGRRSLHRGVDISGPRRTPIFAPAPGVVTFVGTKGSFGKFIEIDHGRGFKTRYGHLDKILVRRGQRIGYRHRVARVGSTGRSTGPHVHYEILYRGRHINPEELFAAGHHIFRQ